MNIEVVRSENITSFIGIRVNDHMSRLGSGIKWAFDELKRRSNEIVNIKNPAFTHGVTPPNYKGNGGPVDFYCCYEVDSIANLPHGMVHIHLLPRMYSVTHYIGPISKKVAAYDYTTQWLADKGYSYDDVSYYFEVNDESKMSKSEDDERNETTIYCPIMEK